MNDRLVWNFPFELVYRMNDVSGWPKILLTLTSRDFLGRDMVCGYGVMHVPTQAGTHTRYMQIFKPKSSSNLINLIGFVTGKPSEFTNPLDTLDKSTGREVTRVENAGIVKVQFTISQQNMSELGFEGMQK